jgi:hypothetical protein
MTLLALSTLSACDRKPDPSPPPMPLPATGQGGPSAARVTPAPKASRVTRADRRAVLDNMMANANVRADEAEAYARASGIDVDSVALRKKRRLEASRGTAGRLVGGAEYMGDPTMDGPPGAPEPADLRRPR